MVSNRFLHFLLLFLVVQAGISTKALGQESEDNQVEQHLDLASAIASEVPVPGIGLIAKFIELKKEEVKTEKAALVRSSIDHYQSLGSRIEAWREKGYDRERIAQLATATAEASAFQYGVLRREAGDNVELQARIQGLHEADNRALGNIQIDQIDEVAGNLDHLSTRLGRLDQAAQERFNEFRSLYTEHQEANTRKLEGLDKATIQVAKMVSKNKDLLDHTLQLARQTQEKQEEIQNQFTSLNETTLSIGQLVSNLPTRAEFETTTALVRGIDRDTNYLASRERARHFNEMSATQQLELLQDPERQQEFPPHLSPEQLEEQITVLQIQTTAMDIQLGLEVVQGVASLFGEDGARIAAQAVQLNNAVASVAGLAVSIAAGNPVGIITSVISISKLFGSRRRSTPANILYLRRILDNQAKLLEGQEEILDRIELTKTEILMGQERLAELQINARDRILDSVQQNLEVIEWGIERNQTYSQAQADLNTCNELEHRESSGWNGWYERCLNALTQVFWDSSSDNRTYQIAPNLYASPGDAFTRYWENALLPVVRLWGGLGFQENAADPQAGGLQNYMIPLVYGLANPANKPGDISLKYFPDTDRNGALLKHVTADYSYREQSYPYARIGLSIERCEGYDQLSCQFKTLLHPAEVLKALDGLLRVINASAEENGNNEEGEPCTLDIRQRDQNQRTGNPLCPKLYQSISRALQSLNITIAQQSVLAGDMLLPFFADLIFRYAPSELETDYDYGELRHELLEIISQSDQYSGVLRNNILLYEIHRQLDLARRLPQRMVSNASLPASEDIERRNSNWKYNFLHYFLLYNREQINYGCSWDCILSLPIIQEEGRFVVRVTHDGEKNDDDNVYYNLELPTPELVYKRVLLPTRRMKNLLNKRRELFRAVHQLSPGCQRDVSSVFWQFPIEHFAPCSPSEINRPY